MPLESLKNTNSDDTKLITSQENIKNILPRINESTETVFGVNKLVDDILSNIETDEDANYVVTNNGTTFYITSDGELYSCGNNDNHQQGTTGWVKTFTKVANASNVKSVVTYNGTTFYITNDGELYSCGNNDNYRQGNGTTDNITTFTKVANASNVKSVITNNGTTFYVTNDGELYSCGNNINYQQGNGTTAPVTTFTKSEYAQNVGKSFTGIATTPLAVVNYIQEKEKPILHKNGYETVTGQKIFNSANGKIVTLTDNEIDLNNGSFFVKSITSDTTFTILPTRTNVGTTFTLELENAGAYVVSFPNTVKWSDGDIPELTDNGKDVLSFFTIDGGATWIASVLAKEV